MRRDHFLDFHRAAESAGYPAMLIVSVVSLGAVVAPLALLALTGAGWLLGVTLLGLIAAVALLAGEFNAAVSDGDEPPRRRTGAATSADGDRFPHPGVKPTPVPTVRPGGRRSDVASMAADRRRPARPNAPEATMARRSE
jgi:hypothetical protein